MAHQIFNAICKVKRSAARLESANKLKISDNHIGEARFVLRHDVNNLRQVIDEAREAHCMAFLDVSPKSLSAIDLMEMGY